MKQSQLLTLITSGTLALLGSTGSLTAQELTPTEPAEQAAPAESVSKPGRVLLTVEPDSPEVIRRITEAWKGGRFEDADSSSATGRESAESQRHSVRLQIPVNTSQRKIVELLRGLEDLNVHRVHLHASEEGSEVTAVVTPADNSPADEVLQLIQLLKDHGLSRFSFAVAKDSSSQNSLQPPQAGFGGGAPRAYSAARSPYAAPSPKYIESGGIILTWAEKRETAWAFSKKTGRWTAQALDPPAKTDPVVGDAVAAWRADDKIYAYSGEVGRWDVLKLPAGGSAEPVVHSQMVMVTLGEHMYIFSAATGQWSSPTDANLAAAPKERSTLDVEGDAATPHVGAYQLANQESLRLARRWREMQKKYGERHPEAVKLKRELRAAVARAFDARQKLHQAELDAIQQQLQSIQQTLAGRNRFKEKITDRRIDELINPNLQWAPEEPPTAGLPFAAEAPLSSSESQALQRIQDLEAAADAESSPSRKAELYRQAASAYEEIYTKHRSHVLGLYARLYQARCLEKLGQDHQARAIYSQLGWTPDEARAKLSAPDERAGETAPPGAPRIVGVLDYDESRVANIHSRMPGRVERLHIDHPGVEVKKGQALMDLYSAELRTAQEEFLTVRESREQERQLLTAARERLQVLGMSSEQMDELEKSGRTSGTLTVFAPFDGVVTERHARQGQHVQEGTHLLTIAELSRLWARFEVPSSESRHLRMGWSIAMTPEDFPGQTFAGKIVSISPQVNLDRTIPVIAEVANDHRLLKPGIAVQAVLQLGDGAASEVNLQAQKYVELAQRRLQLLIEQYRAGNARIGEMVAAHMDLLQARLSGAQNAQKRNAAIRDHLAILKDLLRVAQAQYGAGQATQTDILAIQAEILKTEQRLAGRGADASASTPPGADAAESRPTRPAPQAYDPETQERLLRLDLDTAVLRVQAAKALLAEAEDARKRSPGAVSEATIRERKVAVELAELEVQRAETLLEAQRRKSGTDDAQLERPDSAAHIKEADLAKLAWDVLGMKLEPVDRQTVETGRYRGGMAILEIHAGGPAHKAG